MKKVPTFKLLLQPITENAEGLPNFKWASPEIGTRYQLGGDPSFIQASHHPRCPECLADMVFYAQLDSLSDDWMIGDCGMIYIFVCFECNQVSSFVQSF